MFKRDVSLLILHDKGKILLQKRGSSSKRFPNLWGLFGGGVEEGESPEQALKREVSEELDLILSEPKLLLKYPYSLPEYGEAGQIWVYQERYRGQGLNLREGDTMVWASWAEASNLEMHPVYREALKSIGQEGYSMLL